MTRAGTGAGLELAIALFEVHRFEPANVVFFRQVQAVPVLFKDLVLGSRALVPAEKTDSDHFVVRFLDGVNWVKADSVNIFVVEFI